MRYVDTNTLEILGLEDLKLRYPNTSFPAGFPDLTEFGYPPIQETAQPNYNPITQNIREIAPELGQDNLWYQVWEIYNLTQSEATANQVTFETNLRKTIVDAVMKRLDDFAATRNYSSIFSVCTYVTSTVSKFQEEAVYCVGARDATWMACYQILAEIEAQTRPVPSGYSDIEADLPLLKWPPTANFSADVTTGTAPLTVNFTSTTTDGETYGWDFTNNGSIDVTTSNAQFVYDTPGTYSVKFVVSNVSGMKEIIKTDYIIVT